MNDIERAEYEKLLVERGKAAKEMLVRQMKLKQAINGLNDLNKTIDKLQKGNKMT